MRTVEEIRKAMIEGINRLCTGETGEREYDPPTLEELGIMPGLWLYE